MLSTAYHYTYTSVCEFIVVKVFKIAKEIAKETTLNPVLFSQIPMSNFQAKVFGKKFDSNVYHFDFVFLKDLQSYNMVCE